MSGPRYAGRWRTSIHSETVDPAPAISGTSHHHVQTVSRAKTTAITAKLAARVAKPLLLWLSAPPTTRDSCAHAPAISASRTASFGWATVGSLLPVNQSL